MDVFGDQWKDHFTRICADWEKRVGREDVVLLPGDLSWAMTLEEALPHIRAVGALPGRKIILKGNHDYWWSSISRVRAALPADMYAIQNDALALGGALFCGTRLWTIPGADTPEEDTRVYQRELLRLEMTLKAARRLSEDAPLYGMTHFPPLTEGQTENEATRLLSRYGVRDLFYGHLHGQSLKNAVSGEIGGVRYHPVSCDGLGFSLFQL